ncbi:MAG: DUF3488 domain-containing protein [Phycisphaeraceae bacterium]|nr:DUF3488 domain-containing protein [Phycisphaeraceae bacterium]
MTAFSTTLVSIVAFGVARQDLALILMAAVPAAASWIITEGPRGRGLPKWLTTIAVLGILAWTLTQAPFRADPVTLAASVGTFVLWTTVIKLYERKTTRDRRQLLGLSLVLMLSGCLATTDLTFGVLLLGYTVLVILSLVLYRLERGAERSADRYRQVAQGVPPPPPVFGGRAGRHIRRVVTSALVMGGVCSLLFFVLFPRDMMQRLDGFGGAGRVSGFRSEVDLRSTAPIAQSRREVMRVQWIDPAGQPTSSPEPLRLRGAVLDRYDARSARWVTTRDPGRGRPIPTGGEEDFEALGQPPIDLRQQTYTQVVDLRLLSTDRIFSAWAPVAVAYPGVGSVLFSPETFELRDPDWGRGPRVWSYQVKVQPFIGTPGLMALTGPRQSWFEPRFPVQGVAEEARRVLGQVGETPPPSSRLRDDPEFRWEWARQASGIFLRYLQGSGFRYTTDLSGLVLRRGEDPIDAFLRRGRSGHCELFASALCGMLQSVGVEARVVVGFVAVEFESSTSSYIVRELNAHAWVEVRTGPWAWTTVDPTPSATLEALADSSRRWTDPFRWFYDGIDFLWRTRVVAFDAQTQSTMLRGGGERVGEWLRGAVSAVGDWTETVARQFESGGVGRVWAASVVITLVGAVSTVILLRRRERRWRRLLRLDELDGSERRRVRREALFFADALLQLDAAGLAKPETRPPLLHAGVLAKTDAQVGAAFTRLVELYYDIRFAGHAPSRTAQTEAAEHLRRLESALAQRGRP